MLEAGLMGQARRKRLAREARGEGVPAVPECRLEAAPALRTLVGPAAGARAGGGSTNPQPDAARAALSALRAAQRRHLAAEREVRVAVDRLRATGASWHQVGQAVGVTAEGARKRYG
jgi:hypothetical protein